MLSRFFSMFQQVFQVFPSKSHCAANFFTCLFFEPSVESMFSVVFFFPDLYFLEEWLFFGFVCALFFGNYFFLIDQHFSGHAKSQVMLYQHPWYIYIYIPYCLQYPWVRSSWGGDCWTNQPRMPPPGDLIIPQKWTILEPATFDYRRRNL